MGLNFRGVAVKSRRAKVGVLISGTACWLWCGEQWGSSSADLAGGVSSSTYRLNIRQADGV